MRRGTMPPTSSPIAQTGYTPEPDLKTETACRELSAMKPIVSLATIPDQHTWPVHILCSLTHLLRPAGLQITRTHPSIKLRAEPGYSQQERFSGLMHWMV